MTDLLCLLLGHKFTLDKGSGSLKDGTLYDGYKIISAVCVRCGKVRRKENV
jgi:hypothetical protein